MMRNPAYFQGKHRRRRYFEGWYFKCISADRRQAIAIIPGMAIDPAGRRHAFIQVINAVSGRTWYFHFPAADFAASERELAIRVGASHFSGSGLALTIDSPTGQASGCLTFSEAQVFPVNWHNPGIMGPFAFLPFMECYHAIIHLWHRLSGSIILDGEQLAFTGGVGYIEKDYGRSFPQTYIWLQAGHFDQGGATLVFSRARIPFLGREFPGFFAYFTDYRNITVRFATYNRSRLVRWSVNAGDRTCSGELRGPAGTLAFNARMAGGGRLRAPVDGLMDREIIESITAVVHVRLTDRRGKVLYEGTSSEAGMEICE